MSQIIKKQIRKTIPIFMIVSLLVSTSVAGLVFNLDFHIVSTVNKHLGIELAWPTANANDLASTTVTVRNAPPILIGNVAEIPVSASNTPVNVGAEARWQALAQDPESNDYYLIVCASDAVQAHNGAAPTCGGGINDTFCVSTSTLANNTATCIDAAMADPGAEFDSWYAYVCDNHGTEAECSSVNTGNGDSGSPIYINHAPVFDGVYTSDNNKNPGGTFTVTATTTDNDIQGGADEIYLSVCSTNDWSVAGGCAAATWCNGTSTASNVSCSFATTTPAIDGTYTYYAFVKDWHEMPSTVIGRSATYAVNNVAPSVSNVIINGGALIETNMKGQDEVLASTSATLYDANSCLDIVSATGTIYLSDLAAGYNCADDPNTCYQMTTAECSYVANSCIGSDDTTADYICSTTITYYATPSDTTTGNPKVLENWKAGMTAIDDNGLKGSAASVGGVELWGLEALGINELEIPYGTIRGGQDSGDINATTTVVNFGNVPIDTYVYGTDMEKFDLSYTIPAINQKFGLSVFDYDSGTYSLGTAGPGTLVDTEIIKPTSITDVSDQIFWGINIPAGTTSGAYSGTNTFTATVDDNNW